MYVDDFLLCSKQSTITDHCDLLLDTLRDLGFTINLDKSVLTPVNMIEHIGYVIRTSLPLPSRRPVITGNFRNSAHPSEHPMGVY